MREKTGKYYTQGYLDYVNKNIKLKDFSSGMARRKYNAGWKRASLGLPSEE